MAIGTTAFDLNVRAKLLPLFPHAALPAGTAGSKSASNGLGPSVTALMGSHFDLLLFYDAVMVNSGIMVQ
jgi:hypothetical protein